MAPLLLGANIRQMTPYDIETYTNSEVLAVSQDRLLQQGKRIFAHKSISPGLESSIWARALSDGSCALLFENNGLKKTHLTCDMLCWQSLPFKSGQVLEVRDLWAHKPAQFPTVVAGQPYAVEVDGLGASKMLRFFRPTRHPEDVII